MNVKENFTVAPLLNLPRAEGASFTRGWRSQGGLDRSAEADEVEVDGDGVAFGGIDVDGSGVRSKCIGGEREFERGTRHDAGAATPATVVCLAVKVGGGE